MEYNGELDYERLLVTHYNNKPNHRGDEDLERYYSEIEIMKHYEKNWEHYICGEEPEEKINYNKYAYVLLWQERDKCRKDSENQKTLMEVFKGSTENPPFYFITINYPKELSQLKLLKEITVNISNQAWVETIEYVYEYHTKNGGHPHCHMLIIAREKMPPSKVIDKIFAVKGLKKLIAGKQCIDLAKNRDKTIQDYRNYINGAKKDSKKENCQLDEEWRIENNLNN